MISDVITLGRPMGVLRDSTVLPFLSLLRYLRNRTCSAFSKQSSFFVAKVRTKKHGLNLLSLGVCELERHYETALERNIDLLDAALA